MLNPIFNLPSFLIGMFFGLLNYTIQKGICLYSNESYSRILSIENERRSFSINEPENSNENDNVERKITVDVGYKKIELDNLNNKSNIYENDDQENIRSYSHTIVKNQIKFYLIKISQKALPLLIMNCHLMLKMDMMIK